MSLDGAQIGALAAGVGSLFAGTTVAIVNGLFSRRSETHKATMETVAMLRDSLKEANAREREKDERIDELNDTVGIHHDVIRVARMELSGVIYRDDLNECREELVKIRDKLDTRIR